MRAVLVYSTLCAVFIASNAFAQTDVGVSASVLAAIQPVDDAYVGSPYLSEGIGGLGPGFGAGVSIITRDRLVVAGEYSTVRFTQIQDGRLVLGPFPLEHVPATTRLHDSVLSVLFGYARGESTKVIFLGGVGLRLDRPTINDVEAEHYDVSEKEFPAVTGGVDLLHPLSARAQLVITGRYTFNERDTRQQYLGIGPHVIRAGAGIRIRLN